MEAEVLHRSEERAHGVAAGLVQFVSLIAFAYSGLVELAVRTDEIGSSRRLAIVGVLGCVAASFFLLYLGKRTGHLLLALAWLASSIATSGDYGAQWTPLVSLGERWTVFGSSLLPTLVAPGLHLPGVAVGACSAYLWLRKHSRLELKFFIGVSAGE